jgi:hypothetical protein
MASAELPPDATLGGADDSRFGKASAEAQPNKVALVVVVTAAFLVGAAPAALLLGQPLFIALLAVEAAVTAVFTLREFNASASQPPARREFLLAGVAAAFPAAALGIGGLFFDLILKGVIWVVDHVDGALGLQIDLSDRWAVYPALGLMLLLAPVYANISATTIATRLYPDIAGQRSPYFALLAKPDRGRLALTLGGPLASGIGLAAILAATLPTDQAALAVIELSVLLLATALWQAGKSEVSPDVSSTTTGVGRMLELQGFEVTATPRTGNEALDPLLVNVDMLAHTGDRSFAVEVKVVGEKSETLDWTEGSKLLAAASACESAGRQLGVKGHVEPVLVLVGGEADRSLVAFARDASVKLITVPTSIAGRIDAGDDATLREIGEGLFGHASFAHTEHSGGHG